VMPERPPLEDVYLTLIKNGQHEGAES